jgi:hypothetical protein
MANLLGSATRKAYIIKLCLNSMISNAFFKASYSSRLPWPLLANQLEPTPLIKPIHQVWVATIANLPTALEAPAFAERVPKAAPFSLRVVSLFIKTIMRSPPYQSMMELDHWRQMHQPCM